VPHRRLNLLYFLFPLASVAQKKEGPLSDEDGPFDLVAGARKTIELAES